MAHKGTNGEEAVDFSNNPLLGVQFKDCLGQGPEDPAVERSEQARSPSFPDAESPFHCRPFVRRYTWALKFQLKYTQ